MASRASYAFQAEDASELSDGCGLSSTTRLSSTSRRNRQSRLVHLPAAKSAMLSPIALEQISHYPFILPLTTNPAPRQPKNHHHWRFVDRRWNRLVGGGIVFSAKKKQSPHIRLSGMRILAKAATVPSLAVGVTRRPLIHELP